MKKNCLLILLIGFLCMNLFSQSYDDRRILFGENYQATQKISKESESIIKDFYSDVLALANKFHIFSDSSLVEHGIYKEVYNSFVFIGFYLPIITRMELLFLTIFRFFVLHTKTNFTSWVLFICMKNI